MPSPFPGMDPYLEADNIWEDFHTSLAATIRKHLNRHLLPNYVASLTPRVVYDEITVERAKEYVIKPDVAVWQVREPGVATANPVITPAPLIGTVTLEIPVREQSIEIRQVADRQLVTVIEILSPVNKRKRHQAFQQYRRKRRDLLRTEVHLLEIDLLRVGERPPILTPLPNDPYFVFLYRGSGSASVEIWPIPLPDPLPVVPVPLLYPDQDAPLDLGMAVGEVYDEAGYAALIDYQEQPPRPDLFSSKDQAWLDEFRRQLVDL